MLQVRPIIPFLLIKLGALAQFFIDGMKLDETKRFSDFMIESDDLRVMLLKRDVCCIEGIIFLFPSQREDRDERASPKTNTDNTTKTVKNDNG